MANAAAVCCHRENIIIVASSDVELDAGAAAVWVICIHCCDGQHGVSNGGVLC